MPSKEQIIGNLHIIHQYHGPGVCRMMRNRLVQNEISVSSVLTNPCWEYDEDSENELAKMINETSSNKVYVSTHDYGEAGRRYNGLLFFTNECDAMAFKLRFK